MTYIEMCKNGSAEPKNWKKWLGETKKENDKENELLGLLPEEYEDLKNEIRSFKFYVFKKGFTRSIFHLWGGCYVRYLFETDTSEPHFEVGWIDAVSNEQGFCKIQCDDCYNGNRALTIRTIDVMEILPHKERPLVYYKTMMCGQCNKCDHSSNDEPKIDCPHYEFMNAIFHKQRGDTDFIKLYDEVVGNSAKLGDAQKSDEIERDSHSCEGHCDGCSENCEH